VLALARGLVPVEAPELVGVVETVQGAMDVRCKKLKKTPFCMTKEMVEMVSLSRKPPITESY
jgi:hypothetical protein